MSHSRSRSFLDIKRTILLTRSFHNVSKMILANLYRDPTLECPTALHIRMTHVRLYDFTCKVGQSYVCKVLRHPNVGALYHGLLYSYKDSKDILWISEPGKPKRERDKIFVGKWDEKTHLDYAKNSKKSVVTRDPVAWCRWVIYLWVIQMSHFLLILFLAARYYTFTLPCGIPCAASCGPNAPTHAPTTAESTERPVIIHIPLLNIFLVHVQAS